MKKLIQWLRNHLFIFTIFVLMTGGVSGFGLGIYLLPILVAEEGLSQSELTQLSAQPQDQIRRGIFIRDLPGSDAFHWGEGEIFASPERIWLDGRIAPGPDYRLYLTKGQVKTKAEFLAIKSQALQIAPVKAFENFSLSVPDGLDISAYDSVVIWCEAFSAFITSAQLR